MANKLSGQVRAAEGRIRELEAKVRHHQDRADRAEKWLYQISVEIEQNFFGRGDSRPLQPPPPQAVSGQKTIHKSPPPSPSFGDTRGAAIGNRPEVAYEGAASTSPLFFGSADLRSRRTVRPPPIRSDTPAGHARELSERIFAFPEQQV